ncbi:hypothetical protein GE09DRAFT_1074276 [Coniochaeta sp. 2T2.1]|nr:hypothetical protein GE09DRAFT_1074276 [Coniochaeta sp. 2T2.1]
MPSIQIMAFCEFFFPTRPRRTSRRSRTRIPLVNISGNTASNVYSRVWMSSPTGSDGGGGRGGSHRVSPAGSRSRHSRGHYINNNNNNTLNFNIRGSLSVELEEDEQPTPRQTSGSGWGTPRRADTRSPRGRSDSPTGDWADAAAQSNDDAVPADDVFRDTTPAPARSTAAAPSTPTRNHSASSSSGRQAPNRNRNRPSGGRAAQFHNGIDNRYSHYEDDVREAQTCFIGNQPMAADDANFYDQTIRFRVLDTTEAPHRDMIVVSSPQNMEAVMNILAPQGSDRRTVFYARDARGEVRSGGRQFLAEEILPAGWPFDLVIERSHEEEGY